MAPRHWRVTTGVLAVLLSVVAGGCERRDPPDVAWWKAANRLQASFSLEKTDYFLGEPIYVIFRATNRADGPFVFGAGDDSSPPFRHTYFFFTAINEFGNQVVDPMKPPGAFWWDERPAVFWHKPRAIQPGETYEKKLLVNLWCAFVRPGRYTITCRRILQLEPWLSRSVESKLLVTIRADEQALVRHAESLAVRLSAGDDKDALEALEALIWAKHDSVFPVLERMARTPGPHQHHVVAGLWRFGQGKAERVLLDAVRCPNPKARIAALTALSTWKVDGVAALVRNALQSKDAEERGSAVRLCGFGKYPECLPLLLEMGDDEDAALKKDLAFALGVYGDERGVAVLIKLLEFTGSDPLVRLQAAESLGRLGRTDGVPFLVDLLKRENTPKEDIIGALERITRQDLGRNPAVWVAWWEQEGKK
ncbi:MAG: HEAT repeat domain-containing protein [Planctomycetes bacterium]|nr:HEAT repeat domain-containing protein [Planctomycetota bacterium]